MVASKAHDCEQELHIQMNDMKRFVNGEIYNRKTEKPLTRFTEKLQGEDFMKVNYNTFA